MQEAAVTGRRCIAGDRLDDILDAIDVALPSVLDLERVAGAVAVLPLTPSSGRSELQAGGGGRHRRALGVDRGDDLFGVDSHVDRRRSGA